MKSLQLNQIREMDINPKNLSQNQKKRQLVLISVESL